VDVRLILGELRNIDRPWLVISVAMIAPITLLRAVRFFWVTPAGALPGIVEALRLTLVATALNVFMPAKSGDLVKSYFVATRHGTSAGVSVAVVVYERLCDLFGLTLWCVLGWFVGRPVVARVPAALWPLLGVLGAVCAVLVLSERVARIGPAVLARVLPNRLRRLQALAEGWPDLFEILGGRRGVVVLVSLLLWLVHLIQIWMFTVALSVTIPFTVCASLSAVALMAGQLPLTFAGLGARDVALVVLLAGYVRPESAAALGLLISTRNLLPPLAALPIMRPYLAAVMDQVPMGRQPERPVS
jgi:uncharacterized protein (TIRG00374 family)